ncbi:putative Peptidoglycan domain protein [Tritonibacter multivorans]|uniref:Putative Peptidoglycan domain protein n=1 Tax=Tritonibacter multivorans TaxID=928856 RepID=A0A0P1GIH0_9RHOB|nr:holin-associated N-acetylmuramidase [Tritonibacter multivorans]MDA7420362.1 holin-associated N-acetylmuramidase [Tritonibacter multivorans]CUH81738.1 putative Peptidoglycan domain protein [Tritonibacter multivorans]SFC42672.1 Predicted Peptidoglycan domain-containing protein [Tritonibacter multivorans]
MSNPIDPRQIAQEIIAREGGYVNDPDDPGGATNHGVTIHTMRRLGLDLTRDGQIDARDVRRLTRKQAEEIFLRDYFFAPRLDLLPEPLQATVFDMQVNAGRQAVRLLQRLLRDMGYDLAIDGQMGPQTARAAHAAAGVDAMALVDAYGIARRNYYFDLADRRPPMRKYARSRSGGKGGWITRAESFISDRYHLSKPAFDQRVRKWGS